jgi:peptidoglycan/xylan/chitin deacetylase (PgdA/CDA1 family)
MSERDQEDRPRTAGPAGGPLSRPDHRKGKSSWVFYLAVLALVAVAALVGLAVTGQLGKVLGPSGGGTGAKPATQTVTPSAPGTNAAAPTSTPSATTREAESAAAVKAAAVRFPSPPEVSAQTIRKASPSRKLVAITLDDGIPFSMPMLELFEERHVALTTFVLGEFADRNPDIIRRLDRDGFEIANHTWDHKNLTKLSERAARTELVRTQEAISKVTGNQAPYMRPPGGATNRRLENLAASLGYRVVLWNKTFADTSRSATPERLFHNVMDDLQPGDIILCHWGGKGTYEAMKLILPEMEKRGFTPVTVSELLKYSSTGAGAAVAGQGAGGAGTPAAGTAGGAGAGAGAGAGVSTGGVPAQPGQK